jgi:hypothetical protein
MEIMKFLSLIICLAGLIIYLLASNPKAVRIGEIMFGFGLLVALFKL